MISQVNMRMGELRRMIEKVQLNLRSRLCAISTHESSHTLLGLSLELFGTSETREAEKQNKSKQRMIEKVQLNLRSRLCAISTCLLYTSDAADE